MTEMTKDEILSVLARIKPVSDAISPMTRMARIQLLSNLLAQQVLLLPSSERSAEADRIMGNFPTILAGAEAGMRMALAYNAKRGR